MTRNVAQRAVVQDLFVKARNKCSIVLYCKIQIRINLACNVTANHYAAISNDPLYIEPLSVSHTTQATTQLVTEQSIFYILDHLHCTAEGWDQIPAWFLRLLAPI